MADLEGKRALVTGAARRVGAEIARSLGAERMSVAVHYNASATEAEATCAAIRAAGGKAHALAADLFDRAQAAALVDQAVAALGGLDLLVLSAANFDRVEFDQIEFGGHGAGSWDNSLALNLTAPALMAQRAAAALRASRGSIVLITCVSRLAPYRHYLPYEVSKAAAHQLMRLLALELAPEVRVNAVAPGTVLPPDELGAEKVRQLEGRIPLRRVGSAADVARAVVYLASADWVTGEELVVDGGRSLR
jgi:pteridine reductase